MSFSCVVVLLIVAIFVYNRLVVIKVIVLTLFSYMILLFFEWTILTCSLLNVYIDTNAYIDQCTVSTVEANAFPL